MRISKSHFYLSAGVAFVVFGVMSIKASSPLEYNSQEINTASVTPQVIVPKVVHVQTPSVVKGVYMTACYAGMPELRKKVVDVIDTTEVNSIIIDIKDYTGTVSFTTNDPVIDNLGGKGCKVSDMESFIKELHDKNIYVIGRITVFQDPLYSKVHPELAVKKKSDRTVWKDRKGLSFIDVGAKPYWDYMVNLSKISEKVGFDEINFDYIRFPSDGDMTNIYFEHTGSTTKREMVRQFFEYLDKNLADTELKTSADLFGMVTTNTDDLGIGQVLENALPYFDFIAPMVYPSHYPPNFNGWTDPNKVPGELIKYVMTSAVNRSSEFASSTIALRNFVPQDPNTISSTTPIIKAPVVKNFTGDVKNLDDRQIKRIQTEQLRPWLQDNDYPVHYTAGMVRAQIESTYSSGLSSWMLWDPANTYTLAALLPE